MNTKKLLNRIYVFLTLSRHFHSFYETIYLFTYRTVQGWEIHLEHALVHCHEIDPLDIVWVKVNPCKTF